VFVTGRRGSVRAVRKVDCGSHSTWLQLRLTRTGACIQDEWTTLAWLGVLIEQRHKVMYHMNKALSPLMPSSAELHDHALQDLLIKHGTSASSPVECLMV
jgi:hypothetical protein